MERIELLDAEQDEMGQRIARCEEIVEDLSSAEDQLFRLSGRLWIIERFFKMTLRKIGKRAHIVVIAQKALGSKNDERLVRCSDGLSPQKVKILGWSGGIDDL